MKIRIGNDFVFNWAIERDGMPEDLSSVLEKHLHLSVFGKRVELVEGVDYDITGNVIRIEVTPAIANIIGTYKAEFHYILPDNGLIDEDRKCAVDVDAFQIVARTAQADDSTEFSMTSDMAIAFKGDKGDSAYQVWLEEGNIGTEEDYFAYLRQPAVDAGASISELEGEIQVSEGLRVEAENERVQAFAQMMGEADDKIEEMDTTLSTYDGRVTQVESDITQLAGDVNHLRLNNNIIVNGDFANGTDSWTANSGFSSITAANNILTSTINVIQAAAYIRQFFSISSIGAKIYFAYQINPFRSHNPISRVAPNSYTYSKIATAGEFTRVSGIFTNEVASSQTFIIYDNGVSTTEMVVGSQTMYKNVMFINLLDAFGEGNEPTQTEMDLLMSILGVDFFAGEITVTQRQLMNWQLKMIRQNRNAIVALGGTII